MSQATERAEETVELKQRALKMGKTKFSREKPAARSPVPEEKQTTGP
jgi:hypothetical protein